MLDLSLGDSELREVALWASDELDLGGASPRPRAAVVEEVRDALAAATERAAARGHTLALP